MSTQHNFGFGDHVIHTNNPEWGIGQVLSAQIETQDGAQAQRLRIRFSRAGLKILSTKFADIEPADAPNPPSQPDTSAPGKAASGWLAAHEQLSPTELFEAIPDTCTDPFTSLHNRIEATLRLWRFSDESASLIDWASVQSGLADPLTQFNRHELEQYFQRFALSRDAHLAKLLLEAKRKEPELYKKTLATTGPAGSVVRQFHARG